MSPRPEESHRRSHRKRTLSPDRPPRDPDSSDEHHRRRRSEKRSADSHTHRDRRRDPDPAKRPHRHRSASPRRSRRRSPSPHRRSKRPLPSQDESFRTQSGDGGGGEVAKRKPNFGNTSLLAREANTVIGTDIVLKYHEPPEARKPPASQDWRLFIFRGDEVLETVPLAQQTCWLIGKEAAVADLVVEHPSASKQHAVIQFRHVEKVLNEYGDKKGSVKPYLLDLDSSNGTVLNGDRIGARRFIEVRSGDVMKLGSSEREYVFMLPPKE